MAFWCRQAQLDRSLKAYAKIYPHLDLEFSICDDGSPEPVRAPGKVTYLARKDYPLNPCVPLNVAVRESTGDVIVLTSPEIEHTENVLDEMLSLLTYENDYVMARCRDADGMWLAGPEVDYSTHGRLPVPPGAHFHFCTMFHRSLFERAGGFDEDYRQGQACDDNDFLWRLHRAGATFKLAEGVVRHHRTHTQWKLPHNSELFRKKWA